MKFLNEIKWSIQYEKFKFDLLNLFNKKKELTDQSYDSYDLSILQHKEFDLYIKIFSNINNDNINFFDIIKDICDWTILLKAMQSYSHSCLKNIHFFEKYSNYIDWMYVSKYRLGIFNKLKKDSIKTFKKFEKYIYWDELLHIHSGDTDIHFLKAFSDKQFNWTDVSKYVRFSKGLGKTFKDKLNWNYISKYHILSERTLIEFENLIDWNYVRFYDLSKFSEEFLKKYHDRIFKKY